MVPLLTDVNAKLNIAQSIPIVGPLVFSPCAAIIGLAEFISGFAVSIIFDAIDEFVCRNYYGAIRVKSYLIGKMGAASVRDALVNILTFGLSAYRAQHA